MNLTVSSKDHAPQLRLLSYVTDPTLTSLTQPRAFEPSLTCLYFAFDEDSGLHVGSERYILTILRD